VSDAVLLNLGDQPESVVPDGFGPARVLLSTHPGRVGTPFDGHLAPHEAVVLALGT
jgi:hypothetical protein